MTPLKAWQMQDLSLQCAYRALSENTPEEAFNTLVELSQNFPSRARLLSKIKVDSSFRESHKSNQDEFRSYMEIEPGQSALFINSIPQSLDTIDLYVLLNTLLNEGQMMERLHMIGLNKTHIRQLLTNELNIQTINYILDFRHPSILWLNDLENDNQYTKWPSSYYDLLRNNFFGGLRTIRKNLYNLVVIIDPSQIDTSYELMKNLEAYFVHELPIRIGLIFITTNDYGINLYRAFRYLLKYNGNPTRALNFLNELYKSKSTDVQEIFSKIAKYSGSLSSIFDEDNPFEIERNEMNLYFEQSGLSRGIPHVLFNGNPLTSEELLPTSFEDVITTRMLKMQFDIQQQVYHGQLKDSDDIIEILNTKPNVVKRLNQRIFGQTSSMPTIYVDLSVINGQGKDLLNINKFQNLSVREQASIIMASMIYLGKKDELGQPLYPITLWIACDLDRLDGRQLFLNALTYLKSHSHARLGLLASFYSESRPGSHPITKAIYTAIRLLSPPIARTFILKLLKDESIIEDLLSQRKTWSDVAVSGLSGQTLEHEIATFNDNIFQSHTIFLEDGLHLIRGSRIVLVNGRILGPLHENEQFTEDDFILLDKHLSTTINDRLIRIVNKLELSNDPSQLSDLLMRISSIISQSDKSSTSIIRKQTPRILSTSKGVLHLPVQNIDEPAFLLEAIIDPASRDGQRLLSLISALRQSINLELIIYFNCKLQLSEIPLKSFYRYVYDTNLQQMPNALFHHVPETPILTLGMVTPESWMVEAVTSPYDLDNIHLEDVPIGVNANFELQYLLIEGQCFDETQSYPRGLQLILGTNKTKNIFDTIVMANLGYFQLKAFPGVWHLNLREGRSDDIYTIASHDNTDTSTRTSQPVIIAIRSFDARWIKVYVGKKSGKENEKLLEDSPEDSATGTGSIWDSFNFGGSSSSSSTANKLDEITDDTINIFSVASGHLYERLLRIMMISVLKNTKKPVKFWFLKNFLSPSFTSFLPYYAQHYNFTYELVQYKWPKWLTVYPSEKQRVIWGYKILFLDVLFPLDVKKVIFVDADQVVRADMAELRDLDLNGMLLLLFLYQVLRAFRVRTLSDGIC
jgi:UDP-glucose:glycoprotein glucosyltransferase